MEANFGAAAMNRVKKNAMNSVVLEIDSRNFDGMLLNSKKLQLGKYEVVPIYVYIYRQVSIQFLASRTIIRRQIIGIFLYLLNNS